MERLVMSGGAALARAGHRCPVYLALILAAVVLALQPLGVGAGPGWCRADPKVRIGGRTADIFVSSQRRIMDAATGPNEVRIMVPAGVEAVLLDQDDGFGYGYNVTFVEVERWRVRPDANDNDDDGHTDRFRVGISVSVPATENLPVRVELEVDDGTTAEASGRTNEWVPFSTWL